MKNSYTWFLFLAFAAVCPCVHALITDEITAQEFMDTLDKQFNHECNLEMLARWEYITDVSNPANEETANDAAVRYMAFQAEAAMNASQFEFDGFTDVDLYRRFRFMAVQGPGSLDKEDLKQYKKLQANMETIYSTATICEFFRPDKCDLVLEPDIEAIMAYSKSWDELEHVWKSWRDETGKKMRQDFIKFVELSNKAAELDGFPDTGDYWLDGYTVTDVEANAYEDAQILDQDQFKKSLDDALKQVTDGIYKKLHAYVRMRLAQLYPGKIDPTKPIPAHVLGNMWAQDWSNLARRVAPFPDVPSFDVTDSMIENGWDIKRMFESAEDFFKSIGLFPMTETFWDKSVINATAWGKPIVCHASAEDFCLGPEGDDYRIKMCTDVDMTDLITVHHEMGHIEYFMAYRNLPHVFRESANAGFHEAIGDLVALSVSTPKHLESVLGLSTKKPKIAHYSRHTEDEKRDINFLMKMALDKVAFLPFGYLLDKYRWSVYDGSIPTKELNSGWWHLRETIQGISPPEGKRGEEFFDPGAKYHVAANVPYVRYFVSFIIQFQFHKTLCAKAGYVGPLHLCDIYNNKEAGNLLKESLELGFSEPWPVVLKKLGGSTELDPSAMLEYFAPLIAFLDKQLQDARQCIGWNDDCQMIPDDSDGDRESDISTQEPEISTQEPDISSPEPEISSPEPEATSPEPDITTPAPEIPDIPTNKDDENEARAWMKMMDRNMTELTQKTVLAQWNYYNDPNENTEQEMNTQDIIWYDMYHKWWEGVINFYNYAGFEDEGLKRQFQLQQNIGVAKLEKGDQEEMQSKTSNMIAAHASAVCPYSDRNCDLSEKGLDIEALEQKMANITSSEVERQYYWSSWRDAAGKPIKNDYLSYVELLNKAAISNGFSDGGDMWLDPYTDEKYDGEAFRKDIEDLWGAVEPLYKKLHAYVRHKLSQKYKNLIKENSDDPIPAHLLGSMWGQGWESLYPEVAPYPETDLLDLTTFLKEVPEKRMFEFAETFFTSIGLYSMTDDFWDNSQFVANSSQSKLCQASAWDFLDTENPTEDGKFRIKMCAQRTQEDFLVAHHEMGHTQYQMSYSEGHPMVFRDGANPGFHEAIGEAITLSVSTPSHLSLIADELDDDPGSSSAVSFGLREDLQKAIEQDTNFLMKTALAKIPLLPFAYILDKWRWEVFSGKIKSDHNYEWWIKRLKYQGVTPPLKRSKDEDFDVGSKFQVPTNIPYIRYFVGNILQFQMHKRLCDVAGNTGPIYDCDVNNSTDAGEVLKEMMSLGSSQPWQKTLAGFLDDSNGKLDASTLVEYFKPLDPFLDDYIKKYNIVTGWRSGTNELNRFFDEDVTIPPTVPIIVGIVLLVMVIIVIVAYFVGRNKQRKKERQEELELAKQS
ncbi:angiotensin-converting enzyme-like isoform X2 [Oratosquilla oratoria]|uniref:angiotensin-converting enzyme-like isoform X2 n=1 Tax=Oratosquilla oratoria TaxID=337810 RepID=UPI003F765089